MERPERESERGGRGDDPGLRSLSEVRKAVSGPLPDSSPYPSSQPLPQTGQLRPVNRRASFGQVEGDFVPRY